MLQFAMIWIMFQRQPTQHVFSTSVSLVISAGAVKSPLLQSRLTNQLEEIKGVSVVDIPEANHKVTIVATFTDTVAAAAVVITSRVIKNKSTSEARYPCIVGSFSNLLDDAQYIEHIEVFTHGAEDMNGLADRIAAEINATVIQEDRNFDYVMWKVP